MFCNKCGSQIPDGSLFCEFCGAKQMTTGVLSQSDQQTQQPQMQQPQQQVQPQMQQPQQQTFSQPKMQSSQQPQQQFQNQPAQQGEGKGKKGLIIGLIIGGVVLLALVGVLIVLLLKKDKPEEVAEVTTEATTEATTEEVATVSEATPEEPEEPEVVPYAVENELDLVGMAYTFKANVVTLIKADDGSYLDDSLVTVNEDYHAGSFTNLTVSEPDADGYVTYTLEYARELYTDIITPDYGQHWMHNYGYWSPSIVDYYSGYVLPLAGTTSGLVDGDGELVEKTFNNGEKDITYKTATLWATDSNYTSWESESADSGTRWYGGYHSKQIYIIKVPQDYDGLMFSPIIADIDEDTYKRYCGIIDNATPLDAIESKDELLTVDESLYKKDSRVFLKLSDNAVPETPELKGEMYNVYGSDNKVEDFDWSEKYYNDPSFGGTPVTDLSTINGRWKAYMIWDKDNALDCYGEELLNVEIGAEGEGVFATLDYNQRKDGTEGEWYSKADDPDTTCSGTMADDGSIAFDCDDMNFSIQGFYTDGYAYYGIGTMTVQSGETANLFLYRP